MSGPRILFLCNAGPEVGGGHVMRCLTLAGALVERGARAAFLRTPAVADVLARFGPDAETADADEGFDALVFDHYGLGAADHRRLAAGRPAMVIDDLADRPLGADLVLDAGPARVVADYEGLAPGARLLLGPGYAPVRTGFTALRAAALARRGGGVERILVSVGLTDVGGITAALVRRLIPLAGSAAIDLVLGSGAPSLPELRALAAADARIGLHVDSRQMPALTARADLAIGAGGSATWERSVLGLPSLMLILAPNQAPAALAMAQKGAALVLDVSQAGFAAAFDATVMRLIEDGALRLSLSQRSAAVCDGGGAGRTAEALLDLLARS